MHDAAEVEVDVGSTDMNQFNVVGLRDNAVKESRERIKAALKNRAFAFPYWAGSNHQPGARGYSLGRIGF